MKKQELRKAYGLDREGVTPKRWQKGGKRLSQLDVLNILERVIVGKEPYAVVAASWGITASYISRMVRMARQGKEFLAKKQDREDRWEDKVEILRVSMDTILDRDGVVKSAK